MPEDNSDGMSSSWIALDRDSEVVESDNEEAEIDSDEEAEIHNDRELLNFIVVLQEAQIVAQQTEARNNRPHYYTQNSKRTKQRHAFQ